MHTFTPWFKDKLIDQFFIGYDPLWNALDKFKEDAKSISNYPPYNIKKIDDDNYVIEIAVAGFTKEDITIDMNGSLLSITGTTKEDNNTYIHKGIANRGFSRKFSLSEYTVVRGADLVHGMLEILVERIIPDNKKSQKIEIGSSIRKQMLTEKEK